MRSVLDFISVYVTTLEKMKTDDVEGRRLCLGDYETIEEFYDACRKLHKDEEEPIFWFIDLEAPDKYEMFIKNEYESKTFENFTLEINIFKEINLMFAENVIKLTEENILQDDFAVAVLNEDKERVEQIFEEAYQRLQ